jgi:copper chaperone for superoxide dismutase
LLLLPFSGNTHEADVFPKGAAVSILETYHEKPGQESEPATAQTGEHGKERAVRGLARMVQVAPAVTLVDLTLRGVAPGVYRATVREYGDLKHGAASTGPVWSAGAKSPRGELGTMTVGKDGRGDIFLNCPFDIWEVIGHAMVVSKQDGASLTNDENTVVGVVARSAGMWDNDKTVCSCTGKTLWEEREGEVKKGMI